MSEGQSQAHFSTRRENGVCVVDFSDRKILEELSIREIEEQLSSIVGSEERIKLLLCFENVEHLSSAALGMLISLDKQVRDRAGKLKLCDINPQIYEVFKITRLNKMFEIHDTVPQALGSF